MKKIFTLACLAVSVALSAQNISLYKTTVAGVITGTINNNGGYVVNTVAGSPGHPSAAIEDHFIIKNNAAVSATYGCTRSIVLQSPNLILDGSTNTPNTYFCFGNTCFGSNVNTADIFNYSLFAASGHTSTTAPVSDNTKANGQPFVIYFSEGDARGSYIVQYKIYNINVPGDTLAFKVGYNQTSVGIKTQEAVSSDFISEIYPNPAAGSKVYFNLNKDEELKFQVYNSLGALVYSGSKQKFAAGKNQLPIDGSELSNGMYFVSISSNSATTTKRLIITGK